MACWLFDFSLSPDAVASGENPTTPIDHTELSLDLFRVVAITSVVQLPILAAPRETKPEVWVEGLATYASGVILGLKSLLSNFERKTAEIPDLMNKWFEGNQLVFVS